MKLDKLKYSMMIRWSEEDQCYIVWLPEFGDFVKTHGDAYEEAARNGVEVLEMTVEANESEQGPLPAPRLYDPNETAEQARKNLRPVSPSAP